ncbi:P-loop containing nucleoside triphosphate hydrolase protein [Xylogone sp. PMI_703]|nr:P-loop containing nucleoside triphosphate hydrolase protein [Xylogone sp. PMI_703]
MNATFASDNYGVQAATINGGVHFIPERAESPPSPAFTVPFRRDPDFIGRVDILDQIHQRSVTLGSWTALVGLGGVGKSQLAIECAYRIREQLPNIWIFWVHASNAARFEQGYREIAEFAKIRGRQNPGANIFELVYSWLCSSKRQWILILDNVDDASFLVGDQSTNSGPVSKKLKHYLPQGENGSVLITSRTTEAALKLVDRNEIIQLLPMGKPDALVLLKKKLGEQGQSEDAVELVTELEFMPLAIVQAAAYISQRGPRYSVERYLAQFRESDNQKTSLLDMEAGQLRRDDEAKNSIIITWHISFDRIRQTRPSAADLLSFMSMFDRQGIPEYLVRNVLETEKSIQNQQSQESGNDTKYVDEFEDDLVMLRNYSFVSITGEQFIKKSIEASTFEMHRIVQLSMRKWLEFNNQLERWRKKFIQNLCAEFPTGKFENWGKCQALFPHAKFAAEQQPESEDVLKEWALLQYHAAWYALRKGAPFDAEKLAVESMEMYTKLFGRDHKDSLTSMAMVGLIYGEQGRWNEAEQLQLQVLEMRRRVLGEEHLNTLISMNNLASTYWNQGRWKEAEQLGVQVLEISRRVLGEEHLNTLISMDNLASTYWNQGRWKEAEQLGEQALEMRRGVLGEEHPDTLTSMNNLSLTWKDMGRDMEAINLMKECVQLRKRILGVNHPYTIESSAGLTSWEREVEDSPVKRSKRS